MEEIIKNFIIDALAGFDETVAKAGEILSDPSGFVLGNWETMLRYSSYLAPIALSIAVCCVLWELIQTGQRVDRITWQQGVMIGLKMCLTKVLIDITPALLRALYLSACGVISRLSISFTSNLGTVANEVLGEYLNQITGFMPWIGIALTGLIATLGIKFCGVIIQVMAYSRMFELFVFLVGSPLPAAFFPLGDGSGGGFSRITGKFYREFAAICLQGLMMIVAMAIFDTVVASSIKETISNLPSGIKPSVAVSSILYTVLMGIIALVMAIFSCGKWSRSLLDVGG